MQVIRIFLTALPLFSLFCAPKFAIFAYDTETRIMRKLPIGIQDFRKLREKDCVYVDKTEIIHQLITGGEYYFLSRPRRFGKSLLVSTLKEIFTGSRELFKDLWIEDNWDWDQRSPIIHLPFAFMDYQGNGLDRAIFDRLVEVADSYSLELETKTIKKAFKELIIKLNDQYGKVVLLVDEYDKPIIDYIGKEVEIAQENQQVMKTFYSVVKDLDACFRFVLITGVSKFSKVSIFSDLNNLDDITLDWRYSQLLGYTAQEIQHAFPEHIEQLKRKRKMTEKECLEKMKTWYNGYTWGDDEKRVYNPFSILALMAKSTFANYWFTTATPTFLMDMLKEKVLYDLDPVKVDDTVFESFQVKEDINVISLMFQTGYLTIKSFDQETEIYTLGYPNKEVRNAFTTHLLNTFKYNEEISSKVVVVEIRKAFEADDLDKVIMQTKLLLKNLPYQVHGKEEMFYHAILHLTYYYLGVFIESEVCTSDGRADAIVQTGTHVYCLEFKINRSADEGLEQIRDKDYLLKYANSGKKLVGVGINFSGESKEIDDWKWEDLTSSYQ